MATPAWPRTAPHGSAPKMDGGKPPRPLQRFAHVWLKLSSQITAAADREATEADKRHHRAQGRLLHEIVSHSHGGTPPRRFC